MSATPPRDSPKRVYAGFATLQRGMDGGSAPTLIGVDQYSAANNITIRGDFATTRPPQANLVITADDAVTARFNGKFQGAMWYDGELGESCHIISRGGKLFRLTLGVTNVLTEITPRLAIQTTADFIVPAPAANVLVNINSESSIVTGSTIFIDSGQYVVANRFTNQLLLTYISDAAHATAPAGTEILDSSGAPIIEWKPNPASLDFVGMLQAENYALIFGNQNKTVIFDGSQSRLAGFGEIPPGVMGAYGWGRIWVCLPDRRSLIAGDLVGGPSGNPLLNRRDAILKVTENDYINEGGSFTVPHNSGPITAMQFLATQDTSLGMGVMLVGTTNSVISINAPVDRTTWKNLTYPIQTISLLDYGPQGPRSTIPVNGDMQYRSTDGWRSFITAHRYFNTPGNTPISHEVSPLFDFDTEDLLFYGSSALFDNKIMTTFSPFRSTNGIPARGLAVMNLDLISDLGGKQPPAWEGAYTGLNHLQLVKARIDNVERCFSWVDPEYAKGKSDIIELWELFTDGFYDVSTVVKGPDTSVTRKAIQAWIESRSDEYGQPFEKKKLHMAELYVDEIVDTVTIKIQFRPDQYPAWTDWATVNLCANVTQCNLPANCSVWTVGREGYAARVTLPQPPETCSQTGVPINLGYEFQTRLEITGHCRLKKFRTHGILVPTPFEGSDTCREVACVTLRACATDYFTYSSIGPT